MKNRAKKIDFINKNFTFAKDGKRRKMTKKEIARFSDEAIDNFIAKYSKEFEKFCKLKSYTSDSIYLDGTKVIVNVTADSEESAKKLIEKDGKYQIAKLALKSKIHRCKYCGDIVDGKERDRLCDECREFFGHTYYSEL